jgi:hypothetical protein
MTEFITTREVITNNLAEAQFLLERNHKLIDAEYGGPGATRPRSWFSPSRDLWFTKTDGVSSSQGIRAYRALRVFWIRYSL